MRSPEEWYDEEYHSHDGRSESFKKRTAEYLFTRIGRPSGVRVLDVACGDGYFLERCRASGCEVAGIDLSTIALSKANLRLNGAVDLRAGLAESLPFDNGSFDLVTCFGSLEHFTDKSRALTEMIRVARAGADIFVMVPNRNYLGWLTFGEKGTHQREVGEVLMSQVEWSEFLSASGLQVIDTTFDARPTLGWWVTEGGPSLATIGRLVKAALLRLAPLGYQYQFIFRTRAAHGAGPASGTLTDGRG